MIGWLVALALTIAALAHGWASARFQRSARKSMARVRAASLAGPVDRRDLPEPVQRFIARAGVTDTRPPHAVHLEQAAELRMGPDKPWRPLRCEQVIAIARPGFVWLATQPLGPLPMIRVMDAFVEDRGLLKARLFGSIPVADFQGPEADRSELMRYLAEIPWAPDAALHNRSLCWKQIADDAVELSADCGAETVAVRLYFDAAGDILEMQADERGSTEKGKVVPRPWRGLFSEHAELGGRRIPTRGEVGYVYDHGYAAYWRGQIVDYRLV